MNENGRKKIKGSISAKKTFDTVFSILFGQSQRDFEIESKIEFDQAKFYGQNCQQVVEK